MLNANHEVECEWCGNDFYCECYWTTGEKIEKE